MKKLMMLALCVLVFATLAMAQSPTYTEGSGIQNVDKLGAHQNGGKGCVGCHAPHSGARGNGGNALGGAVTDPTTGNFALWGQDMGPLYGQTIATGDAGAFDIVLPADSETDEAVTTGVMMCLSCHDGNLAKGAMMANQSYEQSAGLLPANAYGSQPIPTLLGADGTAAGNYHNDHPIGPKATLGAVGVASRLTLAPAASGTCTSHGTPVDCLQPNTANTQYMTFISHYGAFNVTQKTAANPSGGRTTGVVIPAGATDATTAYVVCTTCHTPHSMYTFSGNVRGSATSGTYPTYFFISAPYNPGAPIPDGTKASSATQFCRQCHFTGAGGSNEGSNINTVDTQF
ncbi:MAG: hypothetical protein ACE14L_13245 [Terriglobales bacterium]